MPKSKRNKVVALTKTQQKGQQLKSDTVLEVCVCVCVCDTLCLVNTRANCTQMCMHAFKIIRICPIRTYSAAPYMRD